MKKNLRPEEFDQLADIGWSQMAQRLDKSMPTKVAAPARNNWWKLASILMLIGLGFLSMLLHKQSKATVEPLIPLVSHFSFTVPAPNIEVNIPTQNHRIAQNLQANKTASSSTIVIETTELAQQDTPSNLNTRLNINIQTKKSTSASNLDLSIVAPISSLKMNLEHEQNPALPMLEKGRRQARFGVNMNLATTTRFDMASVGGGFSVLLPLGKRFSIEPGVGYGLTRWNEDKHFNDAIAAKYAAAPGLNVDYRVRQSLELPISLHYQPVPKISLTGGLDLNLLLYHRMVFESIGGYRGLDVYKDQMNQAELNKMNRINVRAHGGVAWTPTRDWGVGVSYNQNLMPNTKEKSSKLRFFNHTFKLRMSRYF